jgi:predicted nucleic acid-binding Zn ribbon protein
MSQSSWKDQIKKKWGPHYHCPVCGRAMATDKKQCSQGCKDNLAESERKKKKKGRFQCIILIVMMVGMVLFLIVPGLLGVQ